MARPKVREQHVDYGAIVGQVVRSVRVTRKIPLGVLALEMGLSTSGWSRVETGDTTMTVDQLIRACRALGVEPWRVVQQAENMMEWAVGEATIAEEKRPGKRKPTRTKIARASQSPLNPKQWEVELPCGHQQWITSARKPTRAPECTEPHGTTGRRKS